MKILLLEDDPILSETLAYFLSQEGYSVDIAQTIEEAEDLTFDNTYSVYLLDINLPTGSGLDLLESLRHAEDDTPTIFITALTDMPSMAKGFKLGAIDYIKKPFDPEELLIRLQVKLQKTTLSYGDIEYNPNAQTLHKEGKLIDIGNVQYKIFTTLLTHCGSVVSKSTLMECLEQGSDTALRVAITKIKQKLNIDIKNIRGKGYILEKL